MESARKKRKARMKMEELLKRWEWMRKWLWRTLEKMRMDEEMILKNSWKDENGWGNHLSSNPKFTLVAYGFLFFYIILTNEQNNDSRSLWQVQTRKCSRKLPKNLNLDFTITCGEHLWDVNHSLCYFNVYFEGSPPISYVPMFPWGKKKITKWERSKAITKEWKESCLHKWRFLYSCVLVRFGNTLGLMPSSSLPLGERHSNRNLRYYILCT